MVLKGGFKIMKMNIKKVATILGSALMLGATAGMAAAASFTPSSFSDSGVAIVVGANAANSDLKAAVDLTSNLAGNLAAQTVTGVIAPTVTGGDASALYTSSSNIYLGNSLNAVRSTLTKTEMPTVLGDGTFSGNVESKYTQTIVVGSAPVFTFNKMPTSDVQPSFGFNASTQQTAATYNATVTFNKAIAFNSTDSEGQDITLFGQKFTVASATDATNLVLFKSAQTATLSNEAPTQTVIIDGQSYEVTLVSVNTNGDKATIQINGDTKDIAVSASKKIGGIDVAITSASANNFKYSAVVLVGSKKVTLTDGSAVKVGADDTTVDGTLVTLTGAANAQVSALTKIVISTFAPDSDHDAILTGMPFNDPVFGSFKVDLAGVSSPMDSSSREAIKVYNSGDDKMMVKFTPYYGSETSVQFAKNVSGATSLFIDDDNRNMTLVEGQKLYKNEYVVVGNQDEGRLLKITNIYNDTSAYANDKVEFKDVIDGSTISTTITSEGVGTVTVAGKVYNVAYAGTTTSDSNWATLDYPDSATANQVILYPTIQTANGAKLAFYKPVTLNLTTSAGGLLFPDGDKYNTATGNISFNGTTTYWTIGSAVINTTDTASSVNVTAGSLKYSIAGSGTNGSAYVKLLNPSGYAAITVPAIELFDAKDNNNAYNAIVVTIESAAAGTSSNGIGVDSVSFSNQVGSSVTKPDNSDISLTADYFGTVASIDAGDSDQKIATLSYPKEQITAQVYVAANAAQITAGSTGGSVSSIGAQTVYDNEVSSVSGKNLIVIGGSCINSVAAELLGGAACDAAFTAKTGVKAGEALIKSFTRGSKVALLVAGYNAEDTTKAVTYLSNKPIDTTVGKALKVTSATEATAITA